MCAASNSPLSVTDRIPLRAPSETCDGTGQARASIRNSSSTPSPRRRNPPSLIAFANSSNFLDSTRAELAKRPGRADTLDRMKSVGSWNPLWDNLPQWDPEWTEQFMAMNATPRRPPRPTRRPAAGTAGVRAGDRGPVPRQADVPCRTRGARGAECHRSGQGLGFVGRHNSTSPGVSHHRDLPNQLRERPASATLETMDSNNSMGDR